MTVIVPIKEAEQPKEWRRPMGFHAGKIIVKDDFFEPLPKEFWGVLE